MINNIIFWTSISIPIGYVTSIFINDVIYYVTKKNISNFSKCKIIASIIFFGFLKGFTGNDLVTNIYECFK
jgi:hypothetical protein